MWELVGIAQTFCESERDWSDFRLKRLGFAKISAELDGDGQTFYTHIGLVLQEQAGLFKCYDGA